MLVGMLAEITQKYCYVTSTLSLLSELLFSILTLLQNICALENHTTVSRGNMNIAPITMYSLPYTCSVIE